MKNEMPAKIYQLRGQKVMMDSDLALLYGVETKVLIQAVKRNLERFPEDFMFQCDSGDLVLMKSQFVTSSDISLWNNKRKNLPLMFNEQGIAMLSSVLHSDRAIQVNITIIRTFVKMRNYLLLGEACEQRMSKMETETNQIFKIVFEKLASIEEQIVPKLSPARKKIGLK